MAQSTTEKRGPAATSHSDQTTARFGSSLSSTPPGLATAVSSGVKGVTLDGFFAYSVQVTARSLLGAPLVGRFLSSAISIAVLHPNLTLGALAVIAITGPQALTATAQAIKDVILPEKDPDPRPQPDPSNQPPRTEEEQKKKDEDDDKTKCEEIYEMSEAGQDDELRRLTRLFRTGLIANEKFRVLATGLLEDISSHEPEPECVFSIYWSENYDSHPTVTFPKCSGQ